MSSLKDFDEITERILGKIEQTQQLMLGEGDIRAIVRDELAKAQFVTRTEWPNEQTRTTAFAPSKPLPEGVVDLAARRNGKGRRPRTTVA